LVYTGIINVKLVWSYNTNAHTNSARDFISDEGICSSGYCARKYGRTCILQKHLLQNNLILSQLKKIVPSPEGLASITSSIPSDPMTLYCVICTDPLCPAPLNSSAVKPLDSQTSSETPQNVDSYPDACEPTADKRYANGILFLISCGDHRQEQCM